MRRLSEQDAPVQAVRTMAPDWLLFSADWINKSGGACVAQRSNMDLADGLVAKYVDTVKSRGGSVVFVVTCDSTLDEQFGFAADATVSEVAAALDHVYGLPFVMYSNNIGAPTILLTDADYLLVAGRIEELRGLLGDLATVRAEFAEDVCDPEPANEAILRRALATMDWIES